MKKRKVGPIKFVLQGVIISLSKKVKYLGVNTNKKMNFSEHIDKTIEKSERTLASLSRVMPNINGPKALKRRMLARFYVLKYSTVRTILVYSNKGRYSGVSKATVKSGKQSGTTGRWTHCLIPNIQTNITRRS